MESPTAAIDTGLVSHNGAREALALRTPVPEPSPPPGASQPASPRTAALVIASTARTRRFRIRIPW